MGRKRSRMPHDRTAKQARHEAWLQVISDIRREIYIEGKPLDQVEATYRAQMPAEWSVADVVFHRVERIVY